MQTVAQTLNQIKDRTYDFVNRYQDIRMSVTEALMAQLEEYKSSVDNTEKFGVHKELLDSDGGSSSYVN
jgi:hypothetical protein